MLEILQPARLERLRNSASASGFGCTVNWFYGTVICYSVRLLQDIFCLVDARAKLFTRKFSRPSCSSSLCACLHPVLNVCRARRSFLSWSPRWPNPLSTCQLGTMESYDAPQLERFSNVTPSPLSISFVLRSWLPLFRSFCNSQRGMSIERTMNNKRDDYASLLEVEASIPNARRIFLLKEWWEEGWRFWELHRLATNRYWDDWVGQLVFYMKQSYPDLYGNLSDAKLINFTFYRLLSFSQLKVFISKSYINNGKLQETLEQS